MDNSNNIVRGIPKVNFSLPHLLLHSCCKGILERSIYSHKSCTCLCELRINQNKNFLLPGYNKTIPFGSRKLRALFSSLCHIFHSQELTPFLSLLFRVLATPCTCFSALCSTGNELSWFSFVLSSGKS